MHPKLLHCEIKKNIDLFNNEYFLLNNYYIRVHKYVIINYMFQEHNI